MHFPSATRSCVIFSVNLAKSMNIFTLDDLPDYGIVLPKAALSMYKTFSPVFSTHRNLGIFHTSAFNPLVHLSTELGDFIQQMERRLLNVEVVLASVNGGKCLASRPRNYENCVVQFCQYSDRALELGTFISLCTHDDAKRKQEGTVSIHVMVE